jgi:hypothetical protein
MRRRSAGIPPSGHHTHHDDREASDYCLLGEHSQRCPLRIVFSGGRGGFSPRDASAFGQQQQIEHFCRLLNNENSLEAVNLNSSPGAHCYEIVSADNTLMRTKEQSLLMHLRPQPDSAVAQYVGWNRWGQRHLSLIGVRLRQLRLLRWTDIAARMKPCRNDLARNRLGPMLLRKGLDGRLLNRRDVINSAAKVNQSFLKFLLAFTAPTRLGPTTHLMKPSQVHAEHHDPTLWRMIK